VSSCVDQRDLGDCFTSLYKSFFNILGIPSEQEAVIRFFLGIMPSEVKDICSPIEGLDSVN